MLVIGSEVYSRILNWADRTTCVLFGDGAGAVLLQAGAAMTGRAYCPRICTRTGAWPISSTSMARSGRPDLPGHLVMRGQDVFRQAVTKLAAAVDEALAANGLAHADVDWLVPHQANRRIIEAMGQTPWPGARARRGHG